MAKVTGPLGPRRSIAAAVKELRESRDMVLAEAAEGLKMSSSKLSRLENAQGKPLPRDIQTVIVYYQIQGTAQAAQLEQWVEDAQRPGWWTYFDEEVTEGLDVHLAYEVDATVERVYTMPFVPALLQTADYARAVFRDMEHRPGKAIEGLLKLRHRRQEALRGREGLRPLKLIAVTHESSLHQVVGSRAVLRAQLDELADRSTAPNVSLHVLPFTAKPMFSMTCMYAHFEYEDAGESDIAHIETHAGFFSVEDAAEVKKYRAAHRALVQASLTKAASRDLIVKVRDSL